MGSRHILTSHRRTWRLRREEYHLARTTMVSVDWIDWNNVRKTGIGTQRRQLRTRELVIGGRPILQPDQKNGMRLKQISNVKNLEYGRVAGGLPRIVGLQ